MRITQVRAAYMLILGIVLAITFKDTLAGYPFNTKFVIRGVDDLLVGLLLIWAVYDAFTQRISRSILFFLILFALMWLYTILQRVFLNIDFIRSSFFFMFRDNFWFFPVYYFVRKFSFDLNFINKIKNIVFCFVWIQIGFFVIAECYCILTKGSILVEDLVNGSLGFHTSHKISYTLLLLMPLLMVARKKVAIVFCVAIMTLASARSLPYMLVASMLLIWVTKLEWKTLIRGAIIMACILGPLYYVFNTYTPWTWKIDRLWSQQNVNLSEKTGGSSRFRFFLYSLEKVTKDPKRFLLGYGVASYASRSAITLNGSEYQKFKKDFPWENEYINSGSSFNVWLVEYGLIGTFLLLSIILFQAKSIRNPGPQIVFIAVILSLAVQKQFEFYSVALFYWLTYGIYSSGSLERLVSLKPHVSKQIILWHRMKEIPAYRKVVQECSITAD